MKTGNCDLCGEWGDPLYDGVCLPCVQRSLPDDAGVAPGVRQKQSDIAYVMGLIATREGFLLAEFNGNPTALKALETGISQGNRDLLEAYDALVDDAFGKAMAAPREPGQRTKAARNAH